MKISGLLIAIAIFSGLAVGLSSYIYSFGTQYNVPNIQNISTLNKTASLTQFNNETSTNLQANTGIVNTIFTTAGLIWGTMIAVIVELPTIPLAIISDIASLSAQAGLPIPAWFLGMITLIVTIALIWKVISIFSNRLGE